MANNEVRIISGQWKGRKLKFPLRPDLRPTLGRVRETLFNWLAPHITGSRALDLYAGSGALGFEALSRGAAEVTFVERDRKAAATLRSNIELLGASATVAMEDAASFLARTGRSPDGSRWDLIFFDPPFADEPSCRIFDQLLDERLDADGLLYFECPKRATMPRPEDRIKHGTAGDCQFALYRTRSGPLAPP